jgi:hypothetical protein
MTAQNNKDEEQLKELQAEWQSIENKIIENYLHYKILRNGIRNMNWKNNFVP